MFVSHRVTRAIATLAVLASTATVGVTAADAGGDYPASFEKGFLKSCTSGATGGSISKKEAKSYCKAVLKCIEKKTTYKKVSSGSSNAVTKCSKQNTDKLS